MLDISVLLCNNRANQKITIRQIFDNMGQYKIFIGQWCNVINFIFRHSFVIFTSEWKKFSFWNMQLFCTWKIKFYILLIVTSPFIASFEPNWYNQPKAQLYSTGCMWYHWHYKKSCLQNYHYPSKIFVQNFTYCIHLESICFTWQHDCADPLNLRRWVKPTKWLLF